MSAHNESHKAAVPSSALHIAKLPLPYNASLAMRRLTDVDLVVIHCTELPSLEMSREFGERILYPEAGTGNSGHFYVDTDGGVQQWVEPERVAHHVRGFNERSIGIELVNPGRYPDWFRSDQQVLTDPYPRPQIASLVALLRRLEATIPSLAWLAGHEELDTGRIPAEDAPEKTIRRKVDPGPLFPWDQVSASVSLSRWETESLHG